MNPGPIRRIVIVGGGSAGWMAAAALSRLGRNGVTTVTLVESDAIATVGVGEATIPPIRTFNAILGLDEDEFLRATQGSIKLAIEFVDWRWKGHRCLHPFGGFGADMEAVKFHAIWLKLRRAGLAPEFDAFNLHSQASELRRFDRLEGRGPLSSLTWAYHFDAGLYARHLRAYAEARGVVRREGKVAQVALRPEDGFVRSVTLEGGLEIEGDLFIDCSGFRGLLISGALGVGYRDWSRFLLCDRAWAVQSALPGPPEPFTRATAKPAGWQWRIPLQRRIGAGVVYSSAHTSDDEARQVLMDGLDAPALVEPHQLRFTPGHRERFWERNCVALGLASGFMEPLESTSIHLIQAGITRLLALFPDMSFDPVERAEYNRLMTRQFEQIRDFLQLHYSQVERDDTDFWRDCRRLPLSDRLMGKLELFRGKGAIFRDEDDLFAESSWLAVLLGQGVEPRGWDPLADALDTPALARALGRMAAHVRTTAEALPSHADFLARLSAPRAAPAPLAGAHA